MFVWIGVVCLLKLVGCLYVLLCFYINVLFGLGYICLIVLFIVGYSVG